MSLLSTLNSEQLQAVTQIHGPVLVIAGPGTGKTQILTTRIAYILDKTDTEPSNILCLTFTENGATEMRQRLQRWIGSLAYQVNIHTFHAFCTNIMTEYSEYFPENLQQCTIAENLDKALLFREIIDNNKFTYLKPFHDNYFYQYDFLQNVSILKREHYTPESFSKILPIEKKELLNDPTNYYKKNCKYGKKGEIKIGILEKIENKINKLYEFIEIWKQYEQEKQKQNLYDFDDQINFVIKQLNTNKILKSELQEKYQFILVDEYQDTNTSQNEILWHLCDFDDSPNLFAVGDDDQSIYRFQGANLENILKFSQKFPKAIQITLIRNYRSAQNILDVATFLSKKNKERISTNKELKVDGKNKEYKGQIFTASFYSRPSELIFLAKQIQTEIDAGVLPNQIAILVRENKEVREIASYLQQFGVTVSAKLTEDIFTDYNILQLIQMLRIFDKPHLDHCFFELLYADFWGISSDTLMKISLKTRGEKKMIAELLYDCYNSPENSTIISSESDLEKLQQIWKLFANGRKDYGHCSPEIIARKLFHESGQDKKLLEENNPQQLEKLHKIRKFLEFLKNQTVTNPEISVTEVLMKIDLHLELGIGIFPDPLPDDNYAVQIMTTHKSKGLEFSKIFIPGLLNKVWGNKKIFLNYLYQNYFIANMMN